MTFPQTRATLIERLAATGDDVDWQEFLADYWGPVCRFAWRSATCSWQDAEDVASQAFLAVVEQQLLVRWASARSAKLRTLLCSVVRYVLSNRARVQAGRAKVMREHGEEIARAIDAPEPADVVDTFYAAWADNLLEQTIDLLVTELQREGKGDHVRVLYGKICEGMTIAEIAESLGMTANQADEAYKQARKRLAHRLESQVRHHVQRYSSPDEAEIDFTVEWDNLGNYLKSHGGLESTVRRVAEQTHGKPSSSASLKRTLGRLTQPPMQPPIQPPSGS